MTSRYLNDGKEYAPNMEMVRESCNECGLTHMVQYRVVEVEEETADGFTWTVPDNVSKLRIIIVSAEDEAARSEGRGYRPVHRNAYVGGRAMPPPTRPRPPARSMADIVFSDPADPPPPEPEYQPLSTSTIWMDAFGEVGVRVGAPEAPIAATTDNYLTFADSVWIDENMVQQREPEVTTALDNVEQNPYNAPTGEADASIEDHVGSTDGNTLSNRMDAFVRAFGTDLWAADSGPVHSPLG